MMILIFQKGVAWECKQPRGAKRNMSNYCGEIEDNKFRGDEDSSLDARSKMRVKAISQQPFKQRNEHNPIQENILWSLEQPAAFEVSDIGISTSSFIVVTDEGFKDILYVVPILDIRRQKYEDTKQEKTRNRFSLATLLEANPQNYRVIPHEVVSALLAFCKSGSFVSANKKANNVIAEGYPINQMLSQFKKFAFVGWDQGLLGMCVGEKCKLKIPSKMGYGELGSPPKIPGAYPVSPPLRAGHRREGVDEQHSSGSAI
ncbi:peptidyl-prolyl cis-trans isomerase, FKBP-type protein [Tanacetum coccineum]